MKIGQALKMALRSIWGNKARSVLTMLGIIIGIASVMVIVSTINGMNRKSLEQFEAMGTNRVELSCYLYNGQDPFESIYRLLQPHRGVWLPQHGVHAEKRGEHVE